MYKFIHEEYTMINNCFRNKKNEETELNIPSLAALIPRMQYAEKFEE